MNLPELVVTGRRPAEAERILGTLARHAIGVEPLIAGERRNVCGSNEDLEIVEVPHPDAHLFFASDLYGPDVRALQLVRADSRSRWPWESGHRGGRGGQPVLGPRNRSEGRTG